MGYRSYRIGMHSKDSVTIGLFDQWQKGIEANLIKVESRTKFFVSIKE